MKRIKQVLAIGGIVLLLALYGLTMVSAFLKSPNSRNLFGLSIAMTVLVPIVLYAFLITIRILENKNKKPLPPTRIKNIIFDVGNVLMRFEWESYLASLHFPPAVLTAVQRAAYPSPEWNERDRGLLTDEEYFQTFLKKAPKYEQELRFVMEHENESLHLCDYAESWIRYLKSRGYGTYLLSNISRHMLQGFYEKMHFIKDMDGAVFSCEVNALKPEPEIYQILFDTYGLKPEECIFIDDRPENVEAAKKAGMEAFVFTDFQSAARNLAEYGIQ